jgi:hypothetical protein
VIGFELPFARLVTSLRIVLAKLVAALEFTPLFVNTFVTTLVSVEGLTLARPLDATPRIALATLMPTTELTPVFVSALVTMLFIVVGFVTMLLSVEGFVTVFASGVVPLARPTTSLTIVLATVVPRLEVKPVFVSAFATMVLRVEGVPLARLLVAALKMALDTLVPKVGLTPVFASAFVTMLLRVEGFVTRLLSEVEFVLVLPSPEELTVVEPSVLRDPRLVKVTPPEPGMVPPLVLVKVDPGVVGRLIVGIPVLPMVVPVMPVEPTVTPVPVGVVLGTGPGRPCEMTVPTTATPSGIPSSAMFAASRLLGARTWTCKAVFEAAPDDDFESVAWLAVPTATLMAPGLVRATALTVSSCRTTRRFFRRAIFSR